MPYKDMTKAELLAEIEKRNCSALIAQVAKYPAKPTNDELVLVLETYDNGGLTAADAVVGTSISATENSVIEDTIIDETAGVVKEPEALLEVVSDTLIPVIVTDHDTSMTTEENIENRVFRGSCGNLMTGTITFAVANHGRMQYLPMIVVEHLKTLRMTSNYKDANGKEVSSIDRKRFSVTNVEGWTQDQLEAHRQEQLNKRV